MGWEFRGAPTCALAQPGLYSQAKHVQLIRLDSEQKLAQANCSMENDSVSLKVVTAAVCVAVVLLEVEAAALTPGPLELPIAAAKVRLGAQAAASTAANTAQATTARRHAAIATGESVGRRSSSDREADFPLLSPPRPFGSSALGRPSGMPRGRDQTAASCPHVTLRIMGAALEACVTSSPLQSSAPPHSGALE